MQKIGKHLTLIAATAIAASTIGRFNASVPAQADTCEYEFPADFQVVVDDFTYQVPVSL
jgi:hypothetical protein